jgi:Tfp pilus assembly protein PilF
VVLKISKKAKSDFRFSEFLKHESEQILYYFHTAIVSECQMNIEKAVKYYQNALELANKKQF